VLSLPYSTVTWKLPKEGTVKGFTHDYPSREDQTLAAQEPSLGSRAHDQEPDKRGAGRCRGRWEASGAPSDGEQDGRCDPDQAVRDEDIVSPAIIRRRVGLSQRRFAEGIGIPVATMQSWEQGRTSMEPSARAVMIILARESEAALRALRSRHAA
jgi:DNA-binding transcriptional regulator YiaG